MKKVLIIEDDFFVVRAYSIKFAKENIEVSSVSDGEAAVKHIKENNPADLVILDLMLPKKSGFDVLKEIKQDNKWKNVPVAILSNLGQESDIQRAKEMGAVDYIVKADTGIEEVINRIKKHLSP